MVILESRSDLSRLDPSALGNQNKEKEKSKRAVKAAEQ